MKGSTSFYVTFMQSKYDCMNVTVVCVCACGVNVCDVHDVIMLHMCVGYVRLNV